jgi:hypothetical protein
MRLLIALLAWVAAVAGAVELSTAVAHSIHNPAPTSSSGSSGSSGSTGGGGGSSAAPFDASSVKPTDPRSLFRTANLQRTFTAARTHLGARAKLEMVALYPGYVVLTAVKQGHELDVDIQANGTYISTDTGGSSAGSALFSLPRVKTDVPSALARQIASSGRVPESQLNYMVAELDPVDGHFRWLVYPRQGNRVEYFEAPGATGPLLELLANSATGLQPVHR